MKKLTWQFVVQIIIKYEYLRVTGHSITSADTEENKKKNKKSNHSETAFGIQKTIDTELLCNL